MGTLNRLALPLWWYLLVVMFAGAALYEAWNWRREANWREALKTPEKIPSGDSTPGLLLLSKAAHLAQSGQQPDAIRLLSSVLHSDDPAVRETAHYNLATLYLADGAKLWNAVGVLEYARVSTLVELSKENYREALRLNSEDWDARFNLEYAWRITPPPKERPKSDWKGSKSSVYSTLPGLPGGGP